MNKYQFWSVLFFCAFLSACNNTQSALEIGNNNTVASAPTTPVSASALPSPATGNTTNTTGGMPTATTPTSTVTAARPVAAAQSLYIAPIIGAPLNVVTPLTQRLNQTAQARGLTLTGNENNPSAHVLKGYFSALADAGQTTVLYVWDVLDPAGNRLHRIQGEQKVQGTTADSWGAVTPNAMEAIADQTIQQYQNWKNSSKL
ncbi:hypothetical protein ACI0FM_02340 [Paenochrobactrum sp. BZR 588]|uniref:hypothetical protein n=1 Tax=Paenochrobactrum TaxID=999488 RepID=UPI0035BBF284